MHRDNLRIQTNPLGKKTRKISYIKLLLRPKNIAWIKLKTKVQLLDYSHIPSYTTVVQKEYQHLTVCWCKCPVVWIDLADTYVSLTLHLNCFFTNRSLIRSVCSDNLWPKYASKIFLITKNWCETFKVEIIRSETTIIWGKRWRIKVPSHKIRRQCELQISILFPHRLQQLGWETKEIVWTQSSEKRSAGEVTDQ